MCAVGFLQRDGGYFLPLSIEGRCWAIVCGGMANTLLRCCAFWSGGEGGEE